MMGKLTTILLLTMFVIPARAQLNFRITGSIVNTVDSLSDIWLQDGDRIILSFINIPREDTAYIKNNQYEFNGQLPYPSIANIETRFGGHLVLIDNSTYVCDIVQEEVAGDHSKWSSNISTVKTKSEFHHLWRKFQEGKLSWLLEQTKLQNLLTDNQAPDSIIAYRTRLKEIDQNLVDYYWNFAVESPNKYVVAYVVPLAPDFASERYQALFDGFPEGVKNSFYGKNYQKIKSGEMRVPQISVYRLEKPKPIVGTEVIAITGVDTTKKTVVLNRAFYKKQKYTVIDFWASWCGPCRQLNAKYRQVYDELKKNGVRIVGFSLDASQNRWKGAIKADQTPWLQISDSKANGSPVVRHYSIDAIPTSFVVDRLGKIVARDLSPEQLLNWAKTQR